MLQNYLAAALRSLFRDRAYAALNIFGLALGFATAMLIGLFVRDELTFDRAYPHSERIFRLSMDVKGATRTSLSVADPRFAPAIELDFPEVEFATRLRGGVGYLKTEHAEIWVDELRRADPNFFRLFPPKILMGDANAALERPDMLVITRRFAQRLFGREDVAGERVELRGQRTLHVGAVIENLPSNTHFNFDVVASTTESERGQQGNAHTYVRLRPGTDVTRLRAQLPGFAQRHVTETRDNEPVSKRLDLKLVALHDIHFLPPGVADMKAPADRRTVDALIIIGLLILVVAASNFVSMMTARSARRALEVGVRKAVGATRRQIIVQFLGECFFYTGLALGIATIAVELGLSGFNGFLQRDIVFDYARDPALGGTLVAAWLIVSLAAGAYPALVLSMFRPVSVLKGVLSLPGGPGRLRNGLVVLQFATLVALIISTITVHRQTRFAIDDQLRVPGDEMYVMPVPCIWGFREIAARISGVRDAACASGPALETDRSSATFSLQTGAKLRLSSATVDTDFFRMFGIEPLTGRHFDPEHGEDQMARDVDTTANPSVILNESAARALGYANPRDAVGTTHYWMRTAMRLGPGRQLQGAQYRTLNAAPSQVIGVVPDFNVGSVRNAIEPTVYYIDPVTSFALVLKLDGKAIPETLRALEAAWKNARDGAPFGGQFMSQVINDRYADIQRQAKLFAAFSAVAIIVASLGLLGLAVFTAERRTREIGLRKVMGANRSDILRFIGWQFARPVVIANLLAWPVAWIFMRRWLEGFAYHVDLGPMVFLAASVLAALIALITVTGHALLVARARPAEALRYE
jgi:putative ABC transport system permease protein